VSINNVYEYIWSAVYCSTLGYAPNRRHSGRSRLTRSRKARWICPEMFVDPAGRDITLAAQCIRALAASGQPAAVQQIHYLHDHPGRHSPVIKDAISSSYCRVTNCRSAQH
jgi:hypothetical protein